MECLSLMAVNNCEGGAHCMQCTAAGKQINSWTDAAAAVVAGLALIVIEALSAHC